MAGRMRVLVTDTILQVCAARLKKPECALNALFDKDSHGLRSSCKKVEDVSSLVDYDMKAVG
jgi:hypothetical protein